jgi:hypothetical protein
MSTDKKRVFGTGIMLTMLLAAFAAFADDEVEETGPAVDTSARIEAAAKDSDEPTVDDVGPAVDTSANRNEITRRTSGSRVMDSIELGRTEITGNQELPKVMYIVPWRKADPGDLMGKPINTLLDEVLAPIDREEFIRQVDYYDDLYGSKKE